ncbi:MAG TPA: hypothetical protein PK002_08190 [Cellvibrio sp.]|nr:hypothetical protein [Cellvibrio sp.]
MIKQFLRNTVKSIIFLTVATTLLTTSALAADTNNEQSQSATEPKKEKYTSGPMELLGVARQAEQWFKMPVLIAPNAGTIAFVNLSKAPLSYSQFLTQLNLSGLTAYKSNGYIQIIPNREARNLSIPFVEKNKSYLEDEYVTDVLTTEKACAPRVLAVIRPLVPQYGHLSVYEEGNALIIVDTYGNIQRVKAVIKAIEANLDEKEDCGRIKNILPPSEKK